MFPNIFSHAWQRYLEATLVVTQRSRKRSALYHSRKAEIEVGAAGEDVGAVVAAGPGGEGRKSLIR